MVFHITFMLTLFHDKICCNRINLFSCILWDFNYNEFSIKLMKIAQEVDLATWLKTATPIKGHVRSIRESSRVSASCEYLTTWPTHKMT